MIQRLAEAFLNLGTREEGQTLLEYALVISLVSVTAIALLNAIGAWSPGILSQVTADL
jgi:Flp pilus assembly pilin Flp